MVVYLLHYGNDMDDPAEDFVSLWPVIACYATVTGAQAQIERRQADRKARGLPPSHYAIRAMYVNETIAAIRDAA